MWSLGQLVILAITGLCLLLTVVSSLPMDDNRLDIVQDDKEAMFEKVLYGEPVIFTGDEELLQYVHDKKNNKKTPKEHHNKKEKSAKVKDGHKDKHGRHHKQHTCSPVTLPVCRDLDLYPLAQFPNLLGHRDEREAMKAIRPFLSLMKDSTCGLVLKKFSCLMMSPQCTGTEEPLSPCRSVCRAAKEGCAKVMKQAGLSWPRDWACNKLSNDGLCADLDVNITPVPEPITKTKQRRHSATITNHVVSSSNSSSQSTSPVHHNTVKKEIRHHSIGGKRRYDIGQVGQPGLFYGWADVQGQGAANDYCRVIGTNPSLQFLSCTLGGSTQPDHQYVSRRGFDVGHPDSWFMRDMDGDGRDDYCRCVGRGVTSVVSCMKAGERGFHGSPQQPGDQYTFTISTRGPCFQRRVNPFIGI